MYEELRQYVLTVLLECSWNNNDSSGLEQQLCLNGCCLVLSCCVRLKLPHLLVCRGAVGRSNSSGCCGGGGAV